MHSAEIELARDAATRAGALAVFEPTLAMFSVDANDGDQQRTRPLRVRLLGVFELSTADAVVDMTSLRPIHRMLFATLCIDCGQWTHRDRLVESVWPGSDPTRSAHNLQVALSAIRRLLSQVGCEQALLRSGDRYRLTRPVYRRMWATWSVIFAPRRLGRPRRHAVKPRAGSSALR